MQNTTKTLKIGQTSKNEEASYIKKKKNNFVKMHLISSYENPLRLTELLESISLHTILANIMKLFF